MLQEGLNIVVPLRKKEDFKIQVVNQSVLDWRFESSIGGAWHSGEKNMAVRAKFDGSPYNIVHKNEEK